MRWALILAAGYILCASQPVYADRIALKLSKPNGTWSQYLSDVAACNTWRVHPVSSTGTNHHTTKAEYIAFSQRYFGCMIAKGYRADPNGYSAGGYLVVGDTDVLMPRWSR